MKEKLENERPEAIEQKDVIWGEREKKEKVSVLIGLSRSPGFKPISDMEVGEYEYWLRSNEDLFDVIPNLALELSNFLNQHKYGNEEITYLDFQQLGFKVKRYDEEWCKFEKITNDGEISGKFYFKTKHLMIANWIDNEGENCYNGTIHSKKFLFEVLTSLSTVSREEILGIGRKYMD
jgi:hypothetical protein